MKFEAFKRLFGRREARDSLLELFEMTMGQTGAQRIPAHSPSGLHLEPMRRHRHHSANRAGLPMSVH